MSDSHVLVSLTDCVRHFRPVLEVLCVGLNVLRLQHQSRVVQDCFTDLQETRAIRDLRAAADSRDTHTVPVFKSLSWRPLLVKRRRSDTEEIFSSTPVLAKYRPSLLLAWQRWKHCRNIWKLPLSPQHTSQDTKGK